MSRFPVSNVFDRLARITVLSLSVLGVVAVAGCASSRGSSYSQAGIQPHVPAPIPTKVEVEDDGVPVQSPPVHRASTEPDDPSEPFSPNYGRGRSNGQEPSRAKPAPRPAVTRGYESTFDADGIIANAIAAHEARVR
jgi:hypothetical protein